MDTILTFVTVRICMEPSIIVHGMALEHVILTKYIVFFHNFAEANTRTRTHVEYKFPRVIDILT